MKVVVSVIVCVWSLVALSSCNDAPSDVGSALSVDTLNARSISSNDTVILTKSESVLTRGVLFNSGNLYIGKTASARAATLIRLTNIPDSLGSLTTTNIDSVNVLMRPQRFVIGDSSVAANVLDFRIVELTKAFIVADTAGSISAQPRWNDLFSSGITPNPAYFSADAIASFTGQVPLKDTLSDIVVPMNAIGKQMIASWFVKQADTNLRKTIYGMGFVPAATSTVIRAFTTQSLTNSLLPLVRLKVYYHNNASVRDSLLLQSGNDASYVDADTLSSPYLLAQSLVQSEGRLTFDISSIPITDAILKAQLVLTLDTTKIEYGNIGSPGKLNLITTLYKDTVKSFGASYSSGRLTGSDLVTFSNVGHALDDARRTNGGKGTFSIVSYGTDMERHAVYGLDAPLAKRPKLVITYAARPKLGASKK